MKKRELAAAIGSLQTMVAILIIVVLVGPSHLWALLNAIVPVANVFAWGAVAVLCVVGLPLAFLYWLFRHRTRRTYIMATLALIAIGLVGLNML